jgi:hypothetical protein
MRTCDDQSALESSLSAQMHAPSAAEAKAEAVFRANLAALGFKQPQAAALLEQWRTREAGRLSELSFLYGRDGSLTARDGQGRWWAGTSLPSRVGRSLMKTLELGGPVGCLLAPASAGLIRAVLDKTEAGQATIAVLPDAMGALVALHCEDFSKEIRADRLWLAMGEDWPAELEDLLRLSSGLCIPRQYIRTGVQEDTEICALIERANPALARETSRRLEAMEQMRRRGAAAAAAAAKAGRSAGDDFRVVAGSRFSLWNLAGPVMAEVLCAGDGVCSSGGRWERLDISRPISASPFALAEAAEDCDAIIAADLFRIDIPGCAADEVPWITWATRRRISAPVSAARQDRLLITDERWRNDALAAGWAAERIFVAGWPMLNAEVPKSAEAAGGTLALIADAAIGEIPLKARDFSSQGVLWEQIRAELEQNPLALGEEIGAYLGRRMAQLEIEADAVDEALWSEQLILPAWRRGIARAMARAGLKVMVYGKGWDDEEFLPVWGGPIVDLGDLRKAAAAAGALVHPEPAADVHAIAALGRPVVRPRRLLKNPRQAMAGGGSAARTAGLLSRQLILSALRAA